MIFTCANSINVYYYLDTYSAGCIVTASDLYLDGVLSSVVGAAARVVTGNGG